jgi:DNA-binding CsgD family transcriptional regulator/PAS domain-containing protein
MNEFEGEEPFPSALLGRVAKILPADEVFFNEHEDWPRKIVATSGWWGDDAAYDNVEESNDDLSEDACEYGLHHPITAYRRRTGYMGALADSDYYSRRARLRHDVFAPEFHSHLGIVDALSVCVARSAGCAAEVWFESQGRDFDARDRLVLDLLRPHLAARHRQARLRQLLAAALAALEAVSDSADAPAAVLLVGSAGRIEFASPAARRLLSKYFGQCGTNLPTPLAEWRQDGSRTKFRAPRDGRTLVVEAVGSAQPALLLHEELPQLTSLTAREWDVMRWVEAGKTNDEIADLLFITTGTVKKHLEHVYAKLGVRTRTAALARLRPRLAMRADEPDENSQTLSIR